MAIRQRETNLVSLWRRANAGNVRLYYPHWQYADHFIFRFLSLLCLRRTLRLYVIQLTQWCFSVVDYIKYQRYYYPLLSIFILTHPANFPCGKKPENTEKTNNFQQCWQTLFTCLKIPLVQKRDWPYMYSNTRLNVKNHLFQI